MALYLHDYVTTVVLYLHDYGSNIVSVLNVSRLTRSYQSVSDADHVSLTKPDSDQSSFKLTQVVSGCLDCVVTISSSDTDHW